jgi:hypothetical protein
MSAQPSEHDSHDVIRLGGETALVVPMHEYHTLKALRDRASAEQVEEAEIDAAIAEHEAWKAAGRPGLKSHEEFMAEVFGGSGEDHLVRDRAGDLRPLHGRPGRDDGRQSRRASLS